MNLIVDLILIGGDSIKMDGPFVIRAIVDQRKPTS